jgi:hypothetical protein
MSIAIIDRLREAQRNATGAALGAITSMLSLPHATIAGLIDAVHGKDFNDASSAVMAKYDAAGQQIGRDRSDEIVRELFKALDRTRRG